MTLLHIDFESHSTVDLRKTGVYRYAEDPETNLWCAAYAFSDGPVEVWMPGEPCPPEIAEHVLTGGIIYAWNANFEIVMWEHIAGPRYGWPVPEIEQWRCPMTQSYAQGIPGALEDAAPALGLDVQKDSAGKRLMLQMSRPRKVTKNEIIWWDSEEKVSRLVEYCKRDVETEREIVKRLRPLKDSELTLWHLDQVINSRGVAVDIELCEAAKRIAGQTTERLDAAMRDVTGKAVTACSNRNQIVAWVREQGVYCESIAKDKLEELLARSDLPPKARRVLELRRESAKASVAKIDTLLRGTSADGRARGLLQFGGAARTMRWAGRRFQPQNLKRPDLKNVDAAIEHILTGDAEWIDMLYGDPLSVIADVIRGLIAAPKGKKLLSADYSNIEGRVLAWLAGEAWKCQAFRDFDAGIGADIYLLTASEITGIPLADLNKNSPERQSHGKVPELALGYQGGVGAFQTMAVNYGVDIPDEQVRKIVDNWRAKHPRTTAFWRDMEDAAVAAVETPGSVHYVNDKIAFRVAGSFLYMRLPSGRCLSYAYPKMMWKEMPWYDDHNIYPVEFGGGIADAKERYGEAYAGIDSEGRVLLKRKAKKLCVSYMGVNSYTRKWERCFAYGGLLTENATQAVARDVLADAMVRLEAHRPDTKVFHLFSPAEDEPYDDYLARADAQRREIDAARAEGYRIILTVHDEIVCEVDEAFGSVEEMCAIMTDLPEWAAGLPVAAAGWSGRRYRK